VTREWAEIRSAQGNEDAARRLFERALASFRVLGSRREIEEIERRLR
jgi:hypothetical protein